MTNINQTYSDSDVYYIEAGGTSAQTDKSSLRVVPLVAPIPIWVGDRYMLADKAVFDRAGHLISIVDENMDLVSADFEEEPQLVRIVCPKPTKAKRKPVKKVKKAAKKVKAKRKGRK